MWSREKMTAFWMCVWRLVWWRGDQPRGVRSREEPLNCGVNGSDLQWLCLSNVWICKSSECHPVTSYPYSEIHHVQINLILNSFEAAHSLFCFFLLAHNKNIHKKGFFFISCTPIKVWQRSETREKGMKSTIETKTKNTWLASLSPEEYYWNNLELASAEGGQSSTLQVVEDAQQNDCVWD